MIRNTIADRIMEEKLICGEIKINRVLLKKLKKISLWKREAR